MYLTFLYLCANYSFIMETDFEKFRREQVAQMEEQSEGRCYPEMPEGQFVRSK